MDYTSIYRNMLSIYGKQYWWPSESDCETIIGTILVKNTNWNNVEKSINNLKNATNFDPNKILNINNDYLKELIKPSGFYKAKSNTIIKTLQFFKQYNFNVSEIKK